MHYYFFRKDFQALSDRISALQEEMRSTHKDTAESTQQSSETWHDNFGFEEGQRTLKMLTKRISDLEAIRRNASIVEPESRDGKVKLGSSVTIVDDETGEKTYLIGSYMTFTDDKNVISYASPVAKLVLGAAEGDVREGMIGPRLKTFKIVRVS